MQPKSIQTLSAENKQLREEIDTLKQAGRNVLKLWYTPGFNTAIHFRAAIESLDSVVGEYPDQEPSNVVVLEYYKKNRAR